MSHEIAVDCGGLRSHAQQVEEVARGLDDPINAIGFMTIGSDAYGLMCGFAALPTVAMGAGAGASLVATRELLLRTAGVVRAIAEDFERREAENCAEIRELESRLDGTVYV
jgi:hypothetical protein